MPFPKPTSKKRVTRSDDSDLDIDEDEAPKLPKKARIGESAQVYGGGTKDSNGDVFWDIADKRRLVISQFKGKTMVSVREFYEKDGQVLPGKKGITMPVAQFSALVQFLPDVELALQERGEKLPRPNYLPLDNKHGDTRSQLEDQDQIKTREEQHKRRNFEETSEEE